VINRRNGFSENLLRKGLIKNLLRKGFIENPWQRRDKPAQRFQRKPFEKRFDQKPVATAWSSGATLVAQRLRDRVFIFLLISLVIK
jgi:hypothetical protein